MKRIALLTALVGLALRAPVMAQDEIQKKAEPPRVEVVFVIDTTGSMGGLIEGAKKKVWSIANEIVRGKPTPRLRVGLVAYRDKGDAYVTKVLGLTEDLDKVYAELMQFKASGGGDGPENVRQALHDSLTKIQWTRDNGVLRIVFLVGDAPPHVDYTDVPKLRDICKAACRASVIINTVRCGGNAEAGRIWQDIARWSEGRFVSIDQTGGVVAIATPFDKELSELSDKLGGTVLAFGKKKNKESLARAESSASTYAPAAKAVRASVKARSRRVSKDDLVDAIRDKRVDLEKVANEELPEELKKMKPAERKSYVEGKSKEREQIRKQILEVSKKRDAFLKVELEKRGGKRDSFDEVVLDILRKQSAKIGVTYDKK